MQGGIHLMKEFNRSSMVTAVIALIAGLLFVVARRLEWTVGWLYVGIAVATLAINLACLLRWNPKLILRRSRFGRGTKAWDIAFLVLWGPVVVAIYVVAVREGNMSVPGVGWLLGLAVFVPGWALVIWAMVVNPFFEKTVRIQTDQDHQVISAGPYAYIRHPGYVGFSSWFLSTPLLLSSDWAFIPAALSVIGLVIRTALEDRTLRLELSGYAEYAKRVPFRLIPGIW